jgi:multidrug resistance efflux pump
MMAPEGSEARSGTPVLGFDTSELDRKLLEKERRERIRGQAHREEDQGRRDHPQERRAALAEATSRWRKASLELEVPEELVASRHLRESTLNFEDAKREMEFLNAKLQASRRADEVAIAALQSQKAAAERRVREIRTTIEAMTVKAPRAGTVVYATNWRDEKKKVGTRPGAASASSRSPISWR